MYRAKDRIMWISTCNIFTMHVFYIKLYIMNHLGGIAVAETTNLSIRMDKELKEQAEQLFSELGMNMTTAFNIFVRQAVRQRKIPFEISLNTPNAETIAAMEEANIISRDPNAKRYSSFEELVAEVQNEI